MKKRVIYILSAIVICVAVILCAAIVKFKSYSNKIFPLPENADSIPVLQKEACYNFNPDDKTLMSGCSAFISVGFVENIKGTSYRDVTYIDGELYASPYTNYEIKILSDIKGKLTHEKLIPVIQYGGLSIDKKNIVVLSPLLEEGKYYVLYFKVTSDGTIVLNDAYELFNISSDEACMDAINNMEENSLLYECFKAYENENTEFAPKTRYSTVYEVTDSK